MLGCVGVHLHVCIVTELGGDWHVLVQRDDEPLLYTLVTTISYTTDGTQLGLHSPMEIGDLLCLLTIFF